MENTLDPTKKKGSSRARNVSIPKEPVELYKVLKFEAMVGSGGEAKAAVSAGRVLVNGKVETQKRKKILSGDIIEFAGEKITIQLRESFEDQKNLKSSSHDQNEEEKINANLKRVTL